MSNKRVKENEFMYTPLHTLMPDYSVYALHGLDKVRMFLILFAAGGIAGQVFYGGMFLNADGEETILTVFSNVFFFVIMGMLAIKYVLPIIIESRKKARINSLSVQFKDFLITLSTGISAGLNVNDSLKNAESDLIEQYGKEADIVKEITLVNQAIKNGLSAEIMFLNLGERSGIAEIRDFSKVFNIAFRSGANIKEVVGRTSELIEERISISIEIDTKLTSNKTQMNVMMLIPPLLMIMLKSSSSQFARSFASIPGFIAITIAIAIFVSAYRLGIKILSVE